MGVRYILPAFLGFGIIAAAAPSFAVSGSSIQDKPSHHILIAADSNEEAAQAFVNKLTSEGIGFLGDSGISKDQQKQEFEKLLNRNFDLDAIARFSLGRHWRDATPAQKSEYTKLFKDMIVDVYSNRFGEYQGQTIEVTGSRKEGEKDVLVHSLLNQASGPDVKVDWRVRGTSESYKVIDVIVEGVSMALTQRSDFASVIQRGGGNIEVLLAHLR